MKTVDQNLNIKKTENKRQWQLPFILNKEDSITMKPISLYIHIPFCKSKCYYCDFNSFAGIENLVDEYFKALNKELTGYIEKLKGYTVKSVFFGGGTPSYVNADYICGFLKRCRDNMNFTPDAEITIEANPGTLDEEKLKKYHDAGINRLSMGLQACQNHLLKEIGRIHVVEDFEKNLKLAREWGFDNINADLIFALPGQTFDEWVETLDYVIDKKLDHISCYSLTIEKGTVLDKTISEGTMEPVDEELDRRMYHYAVEKLKQNNYVHYEISNFALEGRESQHNIAYWIMQDYIGFGAGAHSYFEKRRYNNIYDVKTYISHLNNKGEIIENIYKIDEKTEISEYIILGLRMTKGVNLNLLENMYGYDIYKQHGDSIKKLTDRGLLTIKGDRMMLTPKGLDLANQVMVEFI